MREGVKYKINYILYQIGVMFFPYIALYLKDGGYSGAEYGAVMSFNYLIIAVSLPLCSMFDRGERGRKIFAAVFAVVMIAAQWFFVGLNSLTAIIAAVFAASVAKAALNTSVDNVATVYCVETSQEFSKYRSYSSFGYILANVAAGFMYDKAGFEAILIFSSLASFAFIFSFFAVKPLDLDKTFDKKEPNYRLLFTNKAFIMFLIYQILCFSVFTFINHYDIIYQNMRGLPSYFFGITTLIRVGFEILTFIFLTKKKISYKKMLLLAPVFLLIQSAAYFFMIPTGLIFVIMAFAGTGSGLLIFANNKYLNKIVRTRNVTVALYVSAFIQNLFTGIMVLIGGGAIDGYGVKYLFLASGIAVFCAVIFAGVFVKNENKAAAGN
ncbi:MAG: MFS transporter [Clostridiales bacterium]|jgi:predicted MFS family arabinose efflux permease|nr:MFS transporter [Clostridiales bacterium]